MQSEISRTNTGAPTISDLHQFWAIDPAPEPRYVVRQPRRKHLVYSGDAAVRPMIEAEKNPASPGALPQLRPL